MPTVALDKILMQKLGLSEPPMTQSFIRRASTNFGDNSSPLLAESTTDATTALMSQGLRAAFAKNEILSPQSVVPRLHHRRMTPNLPLTKKIILSRY